MAVVQIDRILYDVAALGETRRGCDTENTKIQGIKKGGGGGERGGQELESPRRKAG